MRVGGEPAIGLGVVMAKGGNVIELGENLHAAMKAAAASLPVGVELHVVADQPDVVKGSISLSGFAGRSGADRAGGDLPQVLVGAPHGGGLVDPRGTGDDLLRQ